MPKKVFYTSPKGRAVFPHLNAADTKFKDDGEFHTKLAIPADEAQVLVDKLNAELELSINEAKADSDNSKDWSAKKALKVADLPFAENEEEGTVVFTFKMKASGKDKKKPGETWTRTVPMYDAKGKPLNPKTVKVGAGSLIKVSFEISHFYTKLLGAGLSLRLAGVQILELKEWGSRTASSLGFSEEEGFDGSEVPAAQDGGEDTPSFAGKADEPAASTEGSDF